MADEGFKRKLAAILSADAVEYSRLMAEDETATIKTIASYREIMSSLVKQHRGRVVDSPGDNVLAEFSSVVDAVQCAVAMQNEIETRNAELAETRRMEFRIGINLGDVIDEDDRIYGDGVNIAARLESIADPGGICVSKTAFDQIETKLPLGYEYLGEQSVKNIPKPVGTYRVLMKPDAAGKVIGEKRFLGRFSRRAALAVIVILVVVAGALVGWNIYLQQSKKVEPASVDKMAYTLPDKPSIVVLPFDNMSGDPKQEYFSDGITEELITALSKSPKLFVVARNSAFTYKGKAVKVSQVAEELGVQYVLEGSVRKEGDRVRITAQLIDALKGNHIWAERYDRDFKDIFALQDEITVKITGALRLKLTDGEMARLYTRGTENLDAYQKLLQAREILNTLTPESLKQGRRLIEEAIVLDSEYALAYVYLASTHWLEISLGSSKSPKKSIKRAFEYITKAKTLDDSLPQAHNQLGWLYVMSGQYDKAIAECERAIDLAPNSANTNIWMGVALRNAGKQAEAVKYLEEALRLDPFPPPYYFRVIGSTYSWIDRHEEAIDFIKKAIERAPNDLLNHVWLTIAYSWAGQIEEARKQAKEVLRINPKYSLEQTSKGFRYKNKEDQERFYNTLREAGLPE
jgi:adenylate cyclase